MKLKVLGMGVLLGLIWPIQVSAYQPEDSQAIEITYEEAQELLQIAEAEAGNQGADGQWLVMSVVLNRVNDPAFPDNIHDVIYQDSQFYTAGMGKTEIKVEGHEALARIEQGDVAPEIVAFETKSNTFLDKYFTWVFTYKNHNFYVSKEEKK